jgi:hypothetical protein
LPSEEISSIGTGVVASAIVCVGLVVCSWV